MSLISATCTAAVKNDQNPVRDRQTRVQSVNQTYHLVVNNIALNDLSDVLQVFQDERTISAILWRDI